MADTINKSKITFNRFYWIILILTSARVTILVRQRSLSQFTTIDFLASIEIGLVSLATVLILLDSNLKFIVQAIKNSSSKMFLGYYVLGILSVLWSLNRDYSLFRSFEMIALTTLTFSIMSFFSNFISAEKRFLTFSFLLSLFSLIMHLKLGGWRVSWSILHTNQYSVISSMALVYCIGEFLSSSDSLRKRYLLKMSVPFAIFLIIGTSATSNISAFIGITFILILVKAKKVIIFFYFSSVMALLYLTGNLETFWMEALLPGKEEHEIISLKGRTYIWGSFWKLIQDEPLLGYGFGVVSRMGKLFGGISTTHAHNGWIEVLLNTGILGGVVMIMWLIKHVREIISSYKISQAGIVGYIGAFIVALTNNMGRTLIGGSFDAPAIIFIALIGLFLFHIQSNSKNNAHHPSN